MSYSSDEDIWRDIYLWRGVISRAAQSVTKEAFEILIDGSVCKYKRSELVEKAVQTFKKMYPNVIEGFSVEIKERRKILGKVAQSIKRDLHIALWERSNKEAVAFLKDPEKVKRKRYEKNIEKFKRIKEFIARELLY